MPSESPSDGIFLRFSEGGANETPTNSGGGEKRRQTDAVIPAQAGI
ncbi:hypothetical protein [Neisseria basseii]|nr:hypothetical protein [Neisseria basseii]